MPRPVILSGIILVLVEDYPDTLYGIALFLFFFDDTAPPDIYTLSLHDALPISEVVPAHAVVHRQTIGPAEAILNVKPMVILEGMPLTVAFCNLAAIRVAFEESRKVRESQLSAICIVLNHSDRS